MLFGDKTFRNTLRLKNMIRHEIADVQLWPNNSAQEIDRFKQGDIIENLPLFFWSKSSLGVHKFNRDGSGDKDGEGVVEFPWPAPYGVITSQSCDFSIQGKKKAKAAWIHVAPVFQAHVKSPDGTENFSAEQISRIRDGACFSYFFLEKLRNVNGGNWYANLSLEVPIEVSYLVGTKCIKGFDTDSERIAFSTRLAWLRGRPAYSSNFESVVRDFIKAKINSLDANPDKDVIKGKIFEVALWGNDDIDTEGVSIFVLHAPDMDRIAEEWWNETLNELIDSLGLKGIDVHGATLRPITALSVKDYKSMTTLRVHDFAPNRAIWVSGFR